MPIMHSLYREPGKPVVDPKTCIECGACTTICPTEVLTLEDGQVHVSGDSSLGCIACGHCMMVCPEGAVTVTGRGIAPDDLIPLPDPKQKVSADALAALMQSRRSVRRFSDRDVEATILERIVEMATTAPMGIPPWDVGCVTVNGREEVQRIAADIIRGYEGFLKIFRPWLLKLMRPLIGKAKFEMFAHFIRPLAETYVQGSHKGRDLLFYNAPSLLLFHHSPYTEAADATIACTYAMLAAESLGLGSTIIGGAPPILQRNKSLCQSLGIPTGNTPSNALILGHPATPFKHTVRRRFTKTDVVG